MLEPLYHPVSQVSHRAEGKWPPRRDGNSGGNSPAWGALDIGWRKGGSDPASVKLSSFNMCLNCVTKIIKLS